MCYFLCFCLNMFDNMVLFFLFSLPFEIQDPIRVYLQDIAAFIKKEFDKRYNPTWHVIVGR